MPKTASTGPARLRARRERAGHSLASLSAETGISISQIARVEVGGTWTRRPPIAKARRLAAALGIPLDLLLDELADQGGA